MAETVLVCVTGQQSSRRLIHRGAEIARECGASLLVLAVSGSGYNLLENPSVSQALNDLYALSGEVGAEMTMLSDQDPHRAICQFARARGVRRVFVGERLPGDSRFVTQLMRSLPQVAFTVEPTCELAPV